MEQQCIANDGTGLQSDKRLAKTMLFQFCAHAISGIKRPYQTLRRKNTLKKADASECAITPGEKTPCFVMPSHTTLSSMPSENCWRRLQETSRHSLLAIEREACRACLAPVTSSAKSNCIRGGFGERPVVSVWVVERGGERSPRLFQKGGHQREGTGRIQIVVFGKIHERGIRSVQKSLDLPLERSLVSNVVGVINDHVNVGRLGCKSPEKNVITPGTAIKEHEKLHVKSAQSRHHRERIAPHHVEFVTESDCVFGLGRTNSVGNGDSLIIRHVKPNGRMKLRLTDNSDRLLLGLQKKPVLNAAWR